MNPMSCSLKLLAAFATLVLSPMVYAAPVTSLYGDKDGFGDGVPIADGIDYFNNGGSGTDTRDAGDVANAPNTDIFERGYPRSWTHSYSLMGTPISATLQFYVAGFADIDPVDLLVDGTVLTTYDFPPSNDTTHLLSIPIPLANIDGSTTFSFANGSSADGWNFDFAELTVDSTGAPVPEPTSMALFGLGVLSLAGYRFRRRKKASFTKSD